MAIMLPRGNLMSTEILTILRRIQLPAGIRLSKHAAKASHYSYVRYHGEAAFQCLY